MRIVITGATSFIGVPLVKALLSEGHTVYGVVRKSSKVEQFQNACDGFYLIEADMKDYGDLASQIPCADLGIALAWNGTRGADRSNDVLQESNYMFNVALIEQLHIMGCRKIITAGSQAEYGPWHHPQKLKENAPAKPNTAYGQYKLKLFEHADRFCTQHQITLLEPRFFSLYGPGDYEGTLICSILRKMMVNAPCELTLCQQLWDYLYIDDAIQGLLCLIHSCEASGIYNFGSGVSLPLRNYVENMAKITNTSSKLLYGAVEYPPTGIVNTNPDIQKLTALGWHPSVSFCDGIRNVLASLK